jgi:hypothetical protein
MAEVYLLLDNVTTSPDKKLPKTLVEPEPGEPDPPDLIEEICKIGWPPDRSKTVQAENAATLIRARNTLNANAAPATGATIAFTILVAGEQEDVQDASSSGAPRSWWRRMFLRLAGEGGSGRGSAADQRPTGLGWGGQAPSRFSLANLAFPSLASRARLFRRFLTLLTVVMTLWLVLTSALSWNIATGNTILAQWSKLKQDRLDIETSIADQKKSTPANGSSAGDQSPPNAGSPPAAAPPPANRVSAPASSAAGGPGSSPTDPGCNQLCEREKENALDLATAEQNLKQWLKFWKEPTGFSSGACAEVPCAGKLNDDGPVNGQWASALLSVLGGGVLPILYGVLGAGTAVARWISALIRDSLLEPRHFRLALVRLVLGAVIGGTIGLFVTSTVGATSGTGAATPGVLGAVPLSASALCFIAGFGVDGVFQALETVISRVFNTK